MTSPTSSCSSRAPRSRRRAAAIDRLGGAIDLDALEAYVTKRSPVAAPTLGRVTAVE